MVAQTLIFLVVFLEFRPGSAMGDDASCARVSRSTLDLCPTSSLQCSHSLPLSNLDITSFCFSLALFESRTISDPKAVFFYTKYSVSDFTQAYPLDVTVAMAGGEPEKGDKGTLRSL